MCFEVRSERTDAGRISESSRKDVPNKSIAEKKRRAAILVLHRGIVSRFYDDGSRLHIGVYCFNSDDR